MGDVGQQLPPNGTGAEGARNRPPNGTGAEGFQYYLNQQQSPMPVPGHQFQFPSVPIVNSESARVLPYFPAVPTSIGVQEQIPSPPRRGRGRPPGSKNKFARKPLLKDAHKMVKVSNYTTPKPSFRLDANMAPSNPSRTITSAQMDEVFKAVTHPLQRASLGFQEKISPGFRHGRTKRTEFSSALFNKVVKEPVRPVTVYRSPVACLPDSKYYESLPCESVRIDPSAHILRMKKYPTLFAFFPIHINKDDDTIRQLLDDRVNNILEEDTDKEKWKARLLEDLAHVFAREPHLRALVEDLLKHRIVYSPKKGIISPPNQYDISSIPFQGSYNKYLDSKDNKNFCSGRTQLCDEVLNDEIHSRSSNASFKLRPRSCKEMTRDAVEDARYEVDLRLDQIERTIAMLGRVHKKMLKMPRAELESYEMLDLLEVEGIIHKKTIEWFYRGERVMQGLQGFPILFVPRVLKTLKSMDSAWKKMRSEWNYILREGLEKVL